MSEILTIIGARPQLIKAAMVSRALKNAGIREDIIHTGQHYDHNMSAVFLQEMGIPEPVVNLGIGGGSHGAQTADMLKEIEAYLLRSSVKPKYLMVYGDTNSTLAGALAAIKLGIPVIHVEAGLRSFNMEMPEEINRILTDRISSLLFCSSPVGINHLKNEGISEGVYDVGDVMHDAVIAFSGIEPENNTLVNFVKSNTDFALLTLHRPSNVDTLERLQQVMDALGTVDIPILWPVHPRVSSKLDKVNLPENVTTIAPLSYTQIVWTLAKSKKVLTDSGGLQKEAYWLKTPCITIRNETEWVETLDNGWNILAGNRLDELAQLFKLKPTADWKPLYGDGKASEKIASIIKDNMNGS